MRRQLLRFVAVGSLNTLLGFSVIVLLTQGFGVGDVPANLAGFALGACSSYVLNKTFTFGSRKPHAHAAPAFVLMLGACMAANLAVLLLALHVLHLPSIVAQALAVLAYNVLFFLGSRLVVFKD
ncbi:MAG TPA: GtrA family protein [Albitalea sp.]|uniref:GtrA family protein n=1 Tax=Piscinibacter sp. TaxID=1903157 RepID=UPI002ED08D46